MLFHIWSCQKRRLKVKSKKVTLSKLNSDKFYDLSITHPEPSLRKFSKILELLKSNGERAGVLIRGKVLIEKYQFKLSLTGLLRRKLRMRWFLDVSKVKEPSFLKSDLTDPG